MTDLTFWPRKGISRNRTYQSLTLPLVWLRQFRADLHTIKMRGGAENDSHAVILAVREVAERLRQEAR